MTQFATSSSVRQTGFFKKNFEICGMYLKLLSNAINVFLGDGSISTSQRIDFASVTKSREVLLLSGLSYFREAELNTGSSVDFGYYAQAVCMRVLPIREHPIYVLTCLTISQTRAPHRNIRPFQACTSRSRTSTKTSAIWRRGCYVVSVSLLRCKRLTSSTRPFYDYPVRQRH